MKNRAYIILFTLTVLLAAGACTREKELSSNDGLRTLGSVTARVSEMPVTKAHLEGGSQIVWNLDDRIGIFSDTDDAVPFDKTESGNAFKSSKKVSGHEFFAFFPYSAQAFDPANRKVLHFTLGQRRLSGGANPVLDIPMIAKSTNTSFEFKQTASILHFSIRGTHPLLAVKLAGNDGEIIAGDFTVNLDESMPVLKQAGSNSLTEVYFQPDTPVQLSPTEAYDVYFVLPPMTFEKGFTITMDYDDGSSAVSKSIARPLVMPRAIIKSFDAFDMDELIPTGDDALTLERNALIAFFNALDGGNWINNTNWCSDRPVGEWFGIETDAEGYVTYILLNDNGLNGELPEEIGVFSHLMELMLESTPYDYKNTITGKIPDSIGQLKKLQRLCLNGSLIGGQVPESLGELESLRELYLKGRFVQSGAKHDIHFSGPLPDWIGELSNLVLLDVEFNDFTGGIPESFRNLRKLQDLEVTNNLLTGPVPDITCWPDMYWLFLDRNEFSGSIPASFARMMDQDKHIMLRFGNNRLDGPLPDEVLSHPRFPENVYKFLGGQKPGYKIEIDESKIPATRFTYPSVGDGTIDAGALYGKADYTVFFRWNVHCGPLVESLKTFIKTLDGKVQLVWVYYNFDEEVSERDAFMQEHGIDPEQCIFENKDHMNYHLIWAGNGGLIWSPFVEVVDRDGNVVFVDDGYGEFSVYSFSNVFEQLEPFLANLYDDSLYKSADYSRDGEVHVLQKATEGKGINIVLMGDAFSDRLIEDGTYGKVMERATRALFSEEPYHSLKNRFNVYYVDVVSKNEVFYGTTALNTFYGDGTHVGGNDNKVIEYAGSALGEDSVEDALMVVMMNRDYYAGTCYMTSSTVGDYGNGLAIAYFPTSSDDVTFDGLVSHEAGGHGFAKLADEYQYEGPISSGEQASMEYMSKFGWWKNIDFTDDPKAVKWSKFITDSRYADEKIGVFEGACTYAEGAWRPTENSIMRHNTGGFNAPSREAIYYRIFKLSEGTDWEYDYEQFVAFDHSVRSAATSRTKAGRKQNFVERPLPPLAPPVIVERDFRERRNELHTPAIKEADLTSLKNNPS